MIILKDEKNEFLLFSFFEIERENYQSEFYVKNDQICVFWCYIFLLFKKKYEEETEIVKNKKEIERPRKIEKRIKIRNILLFSFIWTFKIIKKCISFNIFNKW